MTEKAKAWWSSDGKWFCILANGDVNQATVSLTPEEATNLSAALSAPRVEPVAWHPGSEIPPVEKGREREYIVAVYRAKQDKVYTFSCTYLNALALSCDDCPLGNEAFLCKQCTDDGCPTTGWYYLTGENDEGGSYFSLDLRDGDELRGWREIPQWEAPLYTHPAPPDARDFEHTLCLSVVVTMNELATLGKITNDEALKITNKALARIEERRMASLSAPRVEPVAWQSSINGKDWYIVDDASDENLYALDQNGWKTRPLYAHPAPPDTVREALKAIIVASNDFRDGMPKVWRDGHGWEGDPLQDAIDEAAKLLLPAPPDAGDRK